LLKLLAPFHRLAQLFGARPGHAFRVIFAPLPDLILKIGTQRVAGVGARTVFGLEGAVLHLVDLRHFLEDYLSLFEEFAHGASIVSPLDIFNKKKTGKSIWVTILSCTLDEALISPKLPNLGN